MTLFNIQITLLLQIIATNILLVSGKITGKSIKPSGRKIILSMLSGREDPEMTIGKISQTFAKTNGIVMTVMRCLTIRLTDTMDMSLILVHKDKHKTTKYQMNTLTTLIFIGPCKRPFKPLEIKVP